MIENEIFLRNVISALKVKGDSYVINFFDKYSETLKKYLTVQDMIWYEEKCRFYIIK